MSIAGRRSPMWAAVAVAAVIVFGVLFTFVHRPSNVNDEAAVPSAVSYPPGTSVSKTPAVPAFYDVSGPGSGGPGGVVKSEPIAGGSPDVQLLRMVYNSRDNADRLVPVSGLVVLPARPAPPGGFPVVAYAHGTTGEGRACGVSITPNEPDTAGYSSMQTQILPLVREGYAVVATDYLGMGAPGTPTYMVGKVEGQNVLDSIRALHQLRPEVNRDKTVIWGHSQGGHSAAFAAQLAASYAPELEIQGAAVLSPGLLPAWPLAVDALMSSTKPSGQTGFVMLIANSWSATYPDEINATELMTQAALDERGSALQKCGSGYEEPFMQGPMSKYVKQPVPAAFYAAMDVNAPGVERIGVPIVMVQGLKDTTVIPQLTLGFQKQLCNNGTVLDFEIYENQDHGGVVVASRPFINEWIEDRFAGRSAPTNCPNSRMR